MAQPIVVTSSTSLVEVNTLQAPYTQVLFSSLVYPGQTFTVYDNTGLSNILNQPILMSTAYDYDILDTGKKVISTLIDQPNGFMTYASQLPSTFALLNSFPFRQAYLSAGLSNLTASSLQNTLINTAFENVSSVKVENITVTSTFLQSTGLTLVGNLSTSGGLVLGSTLSVYGSTFFYSSLSTLGAVFAFSTLEVSSFANLSSVVATGSGSVGGSVLVGGTLSVPTVRVGNELRGPALYVQASTIQALIAADTNVSGNLVARSSLTVGENFQTRVLYTIGGISSFGEGGLTVQQTTQTGGLIALSTLNMSGSMSTGGNLVVQGSLSTSGSITSLSTMLVTSTLIVAGSLSANQILVSSLTSQQDATLQSTTVGLAAQIGGSVGHAGLFTMRGTTEFMSSLIIGSNLVVNQTTSALSLDVGQNLTTTDSMTTQLYGSVGSNVSVGGSLYVLEDGNLVGFQDVKVASTLTITTYPTTIDGNLTVGDRLVVTGTANIDFFTLPENFTGVSFGADIVYVNASTTVSNAPTLSSVMTSSMGIGLQQPSVALDMSGHTLQMTTLEANLVSSGLFIVPPDTSFGPVSVLSSLGVNTPAQEWGLYVNAPAYVETLDYISTYLSTQYISSALFVGAFKGDGNALYNVPLPENARTSTILASSFQTQGATFSTIYGSTLLITERFYMFSTMQLRDFELYTNPADFNIAPSTNFLAAFPNHLMWLNSTLLISDGHASINEPTTYTDYSLYVNTTMRIRGLEGYPVPIATMEIGDVYASTVSVVGQQPTVVSSGTVLFENLVFLPPDASYEVRSTHVLTVGPYSTIVLDDIVSLQFPSSMGILTKSPNYELDIGGGLLVSANTTYASSFKATAQIQISTAQKASTIYIGVGSNQYTQSKVRYSYDLVNWSDVPAFQVTQNGYQSNTIRAVAYNSQSNLWLTVGVSQTTSNPYIWYSQDGINWSDSGMTNTVNSTALQPTSVAWNGNRWIMGASNAPTNPADITVNIWYSDTGSNSIWKNSAVFQYGTRKVAWNGNQWLAVGSNPSIGVTQEPQYAFSADGVLWQTNAGDGDSSFTAVWDGKYWIVAASNSATGSNFIYRSQNATSWQVWGSTNMIAVNDMAYNGKTYVMVGSNYIGGPYASTILYSADARTWQVPDGRVFAREGLSVLWDGDQFVAGGRDGIRRSPDGITWSADIIPSTVLVIGGSITSSNTNTIAYSADGGYQWSGVANTLVSSVNGLAHDLTTSTWVAVGDTGTGYNNFIYSSNGIDWSTATYNGLGGWLGLSVGVHSNNALNAAKFVAVGFDIYGAPLIYFSYDGFTWANAGGISPYFLTIGRDVTYGGATDTWVAVGDDPIIKYSIAELGYGSGIIWNTATAPAGYTQGFFGVTYNSNSGRYVAVGEYGVNTTLSTILYSDDGITWSPANSSFNQGGFDVATGNNVFVAIGKETGNFVAKYSGNGTSWSNATLPMTNYFAFSWKSVNFTSNRFYASYVYESPQLIGYIQSTDGQTWSNFPSTLTLSLFGLPPAPFAANTMIQGPVSTIANDYPFYGLAYNSNIQPIVSIGDFITIPRQVFTNLSAFFIGLNGYGFCNIGRSLNGLDYTLQNVTQLTNVLSFAVNPTSGTYVAVGNGPFAGAATIYSLDGLSWSFATQAAPTINGNDVAYGNGLFVAAHNPQTPGIGGLQYSGNGVTWSNSGWSNMNGVGTDSNGNWVAVGNSPYSIVYSLNGTTWNCNVTGGFTNQGSKVAYGNGRWVAVGQDAGGNTIKYSDDQFTWNDVTNKFGQFGNGIAFNGNQWIACGWNANFDASTIKYSGDGINWSDCPSGAFGGAFTAQATAATWSGSNWIAVGYGQSGPPYYMMTSPDGINWSVASPTGVPSQPQTIKYLERPTTSNYVAAPPSSIWSMFQDPDDGTVLQYSTNSMSLYPSTLGLNNTLFLNVSSTSVSLPFMTRGNISTNTLFIDGELRMSSILFVNNLTPPTGLTLPIEYI